MSARLGAVLRLRGVPSADRDDIVQEVAARLLSARPVFTSDDDLYGWARQVGIRLSIADHRRTARLSYGELPERADRADVPAEVDGRLRLDAVLREYASLTERDRAAIAYGLADAPPEWDRPTTMRWNLRRHRARERLRDRIEGQGMVVVAWLRDRWRAVVRLAEPVAGSPLTLAAGWLLPVVGTAVLPPVPAPPRAQPVLERGTPAAVGPSVRPMPSPGRAGGAGLRGVATTTRSPVSSRSQAAAPPPGAAPPTTVVWVDGRGAGAGAGGGATRDDGDALEVCVDGPLTAPVVPDGCQVSVTPWTVLPAP